MDVFGKLSVYDFGEVHFKLDKATQLRAIVALLQYRSLVAHGPRAAPLAMCVALLLWLPFCFPLALGCKCYRYDPPPPHWTEIAVPLVLLATLLVAALQCAVALLAFAHRDGVPEARLTTGSSSLALSARAWLRRYRARRRPDRACARSCAGA